MARIAELTVRFFARIKKVFVKSKEDEARILLPQVESRIKNMISQIEDHLANIPAPSVHIVKAGETLSQIARLYNVSLQELISLNDIVNPNLIYPGQELLIPQIAVPTRKSIPGIWAANGHPGDTLDLMYSWNPSAVTCIYDYIGFNKLHDYKQRNPNAKIIIRFMHPKNWRDDPVISAKNFGTEIVSKWNDLKDLDPYVYYGNENNLHYENGDESVGNQYLYETKEFYEKYGSWVTIIADVIKGKVPEMKLITPPFAYGHMEDGAPENGKPKAGWAGYDYLYNTIGTYFDNIITFHGYWGNASGRIEKRLYDKEESSWHAFRWERVLELFEVRYGIKAKLIIDEAGSFDASHPSFSDDVIYYSNKCLSDDRVLALTYFLWLDPTNHPGNVANSWVQKMNSDELNELISNLKGIREGNLDGSIRTVTKNTG